MNRPDHFLNRVALVGLLGGIILIIVLYYPMYVVLPGRYLTGWPEGSPGLGTLLELLAMVLTAGIGYLAVRQGKISGRRAGLLVGGVAGGIAAAILFFGLLGAGAGVFGNQAILRHGLTEAASESEFLWLIVEAMTLTIWWGFGGFMVTLIAGIGLGALGGILGQLTDDGKVGDRLQLYEPRLAIAFVFMLSSLLSLVVTLAIFPLLGEQTIITADKILADNFALSLPAVSVSIWPMVTTGIVYFAGLAALYCNLLPIREASDGVSLRLSIIVAFFGAYSTSLLTIILFIMVSRDAELNVIPELVIVINVLNLGMGLLFIRLATTLDQQVSLTNGAPTQTRISTNALMIAFVVTFLTAFSGFPSGALLILILATAAYVFFYRRHFRWMKIERRSMTIMTTRIKEASLGVILALSIPSMVIVSPALGLVMLTIAAIPALTLSETSSSSSPVDYTLIEQIPPLFQVHVTFLFASMAVGATLVALGFLAVKMAMSWRD